MKNQDFWHKLFLALILLALIINNMFNAYMNVNGIK